MTAGPPGTTARAGSSASGARGAAGGSTGLARSSGVMALGTTVSRLTGLLRTVVLTGALGTALLADTYNVANTLNTAIYFLILGGVLNGVLVPQLVRAMKDSPDGGKGYADRLLTLAGLVLLTLAALATLAAPLIVRLYAQNYSPLDYSVAAAFAYWSLPQIFFYGVFQILGEMLNARGRFGPMMWAPILNNIVLIGAGLLFIAVASVQKTGSGSTASIDGGEIALLGAGSLLGAIAQTLALVPALRRAGYRYSFRTDFRGVGLGRAASLAKWSLMFVAVNQLGYLVISRIGSAVSAAARELDYGVGFTAYQYATLVFQLPHSIITVSVVTALLPRMSRAVAEGRMDAVREDLSSGLRLAAVGVVPAAAAFVAFGYAIAGVLFAGAGPRSAVFIGLVLTALAPGLLFYTGHYLALRGFYAQEDTRTPFLIAVVINAINVALVLACYAALPARYVAVGMAGSYSLSFLGGMVLSLGLLARRTGGVEGRRVLGTYLRLIGAATLAALPAAAAPRSISALLGYGVGGCLAAVAAGGTVLLAGYLLLAARLRVQELAPMLALLRRRLGR